MKQRGDDDDDDDDDDDTFKSHKMDCSTLQ